MSCGQPETDPLVVEDPLDCGEEDIKTDNHLEGWTNFGSGRLRVRKPNVLDLSDVEDDSDCEWRPSAGKRERKRGKRHFFVRNRRRNGMKESETDSDEENLIPPEKTSNGEVYPGRTEAKGDLAEPGFFPSSCEDCTHVFTDPTSLQEHMRIVHNKTSSSHLGSIPPNEKSVKCQKYYEQLKTERKYQCEVCQKTFITSGHLNTHMYRHSGKKWTCDGCGKNFSCERSLIRHKDTFPGEHSFPCKYCDIIFFRLHNMVKHIEIKHPDAELDPSITKMVSNSEDFACGKCFKTFPSSELLAVHEKAMHVPEEQVERTGDENGSVQKNEAKYKCDVCSKEFVSLEGFEYHKNHQHVDKEVKKKRKKGKVCDEVDEEMTSPSKPNLVCKICSATFTLKSGLQAHLKSHNMTKNIEVKQGSLQCCICPRSFTSSDGLKYHLATHTGERRYACNQCGKRFIKKTHLSEHIATHSQVKYFKCRRCPRTFSTHSAYRKHIKHFPGPHSFPCSKCGKIFTKESMIEKHMCVDLVKITMAPEVKALLSEDMIEEYLCLAEEQMVEELSENSKESEKKQSKENTSHSCYKCFKVFPTLASLQEHQNDHIGKQNYQCRFCPENFKRADAFGAHIRNHLGSTPYMCLKCNRKFISPVTLSMHAKTYPGDHSFTCQKCQRWFPSETRLEKHECILQNSDHFKCACGSIFSSWNELLQHAGTKPYKCCSCELQYSTLMALARHIKKHTGVKPFSCDVCGKSFRAKSNYLNHQGIHLKRTDIQCEHCEYKSKSQKRMDLHLFR
ncbi:UNVERIFIED_CONTAM: hypothetical protein PYX00_010472 [Menopon gallinae]